MSSMTVFSMNRIPIRVAVVDDDRSVCKALHRLLTVAGFHLATFGSGGEFLATIRLAMPDCLILDLNMPAMTGREVLETISERIPNLPVIILTATESPEARAVCDGLGVAAYLTKPVREDELVGAIFSAIPSMERLSSSRQVGTESDWIRARRVPEASIQINR